MYWVCDEVIIYIIMITEQLNCVPAVFFLDVCIRPAEQISMTSLAVSDVGVWSHPPRVISGHTLRQVHCVGMWDICTCILLGNQSTTDFLWSGVCGKWLFTRTTYTCTCVGWSPLHFMYTVNHDNNSGITAFHCMFPAGLDLQLTSLINKTFNNWQY